jgi:glycosyltransferase involved in cell wall biosynthesis
MRVVLLGPYPFDGKRAGGGVETSFVNLVEGLRSVADVEPHVATFVRGAAEARRVETPAGTVHYLPGRARLNNLTFYRANRRVFERLLAELEPDLVHAQDAAGSGYAALRTAGRIPVVVSIHGIVREEPRHLAGRADRIRTRLARVAVERYCIRHAEYLVAPTRFPAEYFGAEIRGRFLEVDNAVATRFFEPVRAPVPGRVLYVGGITRGKRLLDAVDALVAVRRQVPDVELRVAGPATDSAYAARVAARVRELGLGPNVELLGALPEERLLDEYRRARVLVLPSSQETSPMVIAEAMAVGVPVVATRTGGIPSLVADGETGWLVDVGDVAALADRLVRVLGDDNRTQSMARAARIVAADRFEPAAVATRMHDVYLAALAGARA